MKIFTSILILFQVTLLCAQQPTLTTIEDLFREGFWDNALQMVEKETDPMRRRQKIDLGFSVLPASYSLTHEQILKVMALYGTDLHDETRAKVLDHIERVISDTLDPKYPPLLEGLKKGVGCYGGKDRDKCYALSRFLSERSSLLELQSEFLPDWHHALATKQIVMIDHITQFHVKRADRSGRKADADSAFYCVTTQLLDTTLHASIRPRLEENLLKLSTAIDSDKFNNFLKPYLFSNAGFAQRMIELMYNKLERDIQSSMVKKGNARFTWVPDFQRLKSLLIVIAEQNIPSYNEQSKQVILLRVATLWRDKIKEFVRQDDRNLQRIRYRYNRDVSENDLLKPRDANLLLSLAPEGKWYNYPMLVAQKPSIIEAKIELMAVAKRFSEAAELIQELKANRSQMLIQSEHLLQRMTTILNPNNSLELTNPTDRYQQFNTRPTISMTRLRQKKNIETLKSVLAQFDAMGVRPTTSKILDVFDKIHSQAEVYNYDDLYAIFGDPAKMNEKDVFALGQQMKNKLIKQWQQTDVQIVTGTKRTERETLLMANSGYATLEKLMSRACEGNSGKGYLGHAFRGAILYQWADFMRKTGVDSAHVASVQTQGLQAIEKAAERYVTKVPSLYQSDYSVNVYLFWFKAFVEAGFGKQSVKDRPNIGAIRESIMKMPPDAAQKHLEMLSELFLDEIPKQKAGDRQFFLSACLKIIEGTPIGLGFQDRLEYYNELLDEAQLVTIPETFEGKVADDMIGFTIYLNHTRELSREAGGFNRYLNIGGSPQNMQMLGMGEESSIASREFFERRIHEALEEQFEIVSLLFADPSITPLILDNSMLSLPLATVIVRPKDKSIDHIPAIQMDLEFADASEMVVLAVASTPVPIKMSASESIQTPHDLKIRQRVNFVNIADGRIRLDITATASELIGSYDATFPSKKIEGLLVSDIEDFGVQPTAMKVENNQFKSSYERTWTLHLKPEDPTKIPSTFYFVEPKKAVENITSYTHDVNYKPCDGFCPMTYTEVAHVFADQFSWKSVIISIVALIVLLFIMIMFVVKRKKKPIKERIVEPKTPFSMHRFLVNVLNERRTLTDEDKKQIRASIVEIESAYFSATGKELDEKQLHQLYLRWR